MDRENLSLLWHRFVFNPVYTTYGRLRYNARRYPMRFAVFLFVLILIILSIALSVRS